MRQIVLDLVRVAKVLVSDEPMTFEEPSNHTKRWAKTNLMLALRVDNSWKQIYESFLTFQEGSSNKFHYFSVWKSKTGECVGGNAFGRIGYNPKGFEIARGNESSVMSAVRGKESVKRSNGYQTTEV